MNKFNSNKKKKKNIEAEKKIAHSLCTQGRDAVSFSFNLIFFHIQKKKKLANQTTHGKYN